MAQNSATDEAIESVDMIENTITPMDVIDPVTEAASKDRYLTGPRLWFAGFG